MKEKIKSLLKNKVFLGCASGVMVLAIVIATVLLLPDKKANLPDSTETSGTSETQSIPDIDAPDTTSEPVSTETESMPSDITVDVGDVTQNGDVQTGGKAETPANPVAEKEPEKPVNANNGNDNAGADTGGITIGNPPIKEDYSCGTANHHCKNPDAHAYILNLELDGCEMCGSHSCPSFYATDEWGGATIDYTKCPEYSDKNDPTKYCQACGRPLWSQSNPTGCFRYLQDTTCECGELVKGNTCHHH